MQPDVFVVGLREGKLPPYPFELVDLVLAIEVASPNNPEYDYQTKRELYLGNRIPEYWIVDPRTRTLARWRGASDSGELLVHRIEWQPSGLDAPLVIELPEFFDDALG